MVKESFPSFLYDQFRTVPVPEIVDLTGRVVIVTGSNIGLGRAAAEALSKFTPTKLILAVRNVAAGETAAKEIYEANGQKLMPDVWTLDMGSFKSVKAFTDRINSELDRLDIFVANAGVVFGKRIDTTDGYETTIQVNGISTALLATLVVPIMKKTAALPVPPGGQPFKPHLEIVASEVHLGITELPGQDEGKVIASLNETMPSNRYPQSKALNVFNVKTLARLVGLVLSDDIVVTSVNPGLCHSGLARSFEGVKAYLFSLFKMILARTQEVGARNLVWAATTPDVKSGSYVSICAEAEPSDLVLSEKSTEIGNGIWREYETIWKEKVGVDAKEVLGYTSL